MYTGGCAVNSTGVLTLRSGVSSFTQRRVCCTGEAAETGDCGSTGCLSSPASAFFARELSLSPAFLYSHYYYLRRRPAFLYSIPNPAAYITRLYGRSEVRCREKALLGLSARRASTRRLISCCCVVGACSEHEPMCVCRGLLEDAEQEELEEKEEEGCCPGHDTVSISGYSNSESWENEAENKGYGRKAESERVSRWGYGRTSTTDGSTIAVKNRKKQNKVRTSTSVTSNGFFGDSHSQKNSHSSRRDESTARVQDSVHNKLLGRSSHISSLSETKNTSFQQNNSSSKKVVDSRFSSKVGEEFSSDASYQIRQGRIHTDTRQENTERRSQKGSEVLNATCQADHNLNVADIQANKTDEAALVERLIEEVRRQSIEIEKLRESYKALESRSELRQSRTEAVTRVETNEYSSASISNLVEELRRQLIEINSLSRSYQELNASIAYKNDTKRLSHSSRQSISNINDREERFTSVVNLEREENEQRIRQKQSRVDQKKVVNSSEIYETDVLKKSSSYEVYKTNFREEEESSTSAIYVTKDSRKQHEQKALANESFGELIGPSRVSSIENQQSCSLDGALMSQHDDQEQRVASALHSIEEWRENLAHQAESEKDHEKRSEPVKLPEAGSKYGTRPIPLTSSGPKGKEVVSEFDKYANEESKYHKEISTSQQIIDIDLSLDSFKSSEILGTEETLLKDDVLDKTQGVKPEGKSSQFSMQNLENDNTETSELLEKRSGSTSSINDSYENLVLGSGGSQMHAQQTHQIGPIKNNDSCDDRQDVLESARLLNASSSSYVAEFVSELKKETSGTQELDISLGHSSPRVGELDNTEEINRKSEKIKSGMQQNTPALLEKSKSERYTEEALNQLERLPEAAGPSDEMWDLTSSSRQACQKDKENKEVSEDKVDETLAGINSGNTVAKRSGRSLWNLIADIIRISWASNAGKSHKSTTQSGTRSSSNESTGSEVWFSGHEHEEDSNEPSKQRKKPSEEESDITSKPQESACSQEPAKPQNKDAQKDTGLFAENSNKKNASVGSSIVTGNLGLNAEDLVGSSIPYVSGMLNSSASKITLVSSVESEIEKLDRNPIHEIAAETLGHDSSNENPHGIKEPGETDGDLRRRKFQRNKQVLRDKFDEWEEAHNMETVQRKKDEFFMKEALLEAKKAAESWEVPIGAVLVQNGKIIARSGNMVEECRDSTAHAEIVCIREASKLLKTWRLSETILYVTLEPCAMCAGAILQARVDTVVWGAPNKLLGADGSWVRLFPSGIGEQPSLDNADQTAGPIHPFHPKIIVRRGVLGTECADIMQQFFQLRRKEKRQETPGPSRLSVSKHPTRFLAKMHDVFSMMFCL